MKTSKKKIVKAKEFDEAFEKGDVTEHLDLKSIKVNYPVQRINVDIPKNILEQLDHEAARIGVTRTALIKIWIAEKLMDTTAGAHA